VSSPGLLTFADERGPAAPPGGGAAGLPCLFSHNSDSHREKVGGNSEKRLSGIDRKRAEATRQNIQAFAQLHGTSTGVLTITFGEHLSTKEAQNRLANFKRRVLKEHFGESITVREFTKRGRPHFHVVIDCLGDIAQGFSWEYYDAIRAWYKGGKKGAKPSGSLGRCARLVELHGILNAKKEAYHLGEVLELVPVRFADRVGFYLGGYLSKSLANKPEDAKRTRAVNYSHHAPRVFKGDSSWANESAWLWRAKLQIWASSHGIASYEEIAEVFGPRWAWWHADAIVSVKLTDYLTHYPTVEHARRDGREVEQLPPDAVDIVFPVTEPVPRAVLPFDQEDQEAWLSLFTGPEKDLPNGGWPEGTGPDRQKEDQQEEFQELQGQEEEQEDPVWVPEWVSTARPPGPYVLRRPPVKCEEQERIFAEVMVRQMEVRARHDELKALNTAFRKEAELRREVRKFE